MSIFRGCRYQVVVRAPDERLWSRHSTLTQAHRSFCEVVNNRRGDHEPGTHVELRDVGGGASDVLAQGTARA